MSSRAIRDILHQMSRSHVLWTLLFPVGCFLVARLLAIQCYGRPFALYVICLAVPGAIAGILGFLFGLLGAAVIFCAFAGLGGMVGAMTARWRCGGCMEMPDPTTLTEGERRAAAATQSKLVFGGAGLLGLSFLLGVIYLAMA